MNVTRPQTKQKVFLALTAIHRNAVNGKPCSVSGEFKKQGIGAATTTKLKQALLALNLIKIDGKKISWNRQKSIPTLQMVDGLYITAKQIKEEKEDKKETKKSNTSSIIYIVREICVFDGQPSFERPFISRDESASKCYFDTKVAQWKKMFPNCNTKYDLDKITITFGNSIIFVEKYSQEL